ncbi:coiled coil helix coiled coil helix [Schistosoma japonicum]|nr:coiled coil helix coiled coil helix [Schistosoma japonicum]KAH8873678.1 coiled coil helix coiled coil helix [Schistosoma japonicum]KAH8873679.1 coiled coil helix coiled coil helix [Schistosoma japonicum]
MLLMLACLKESDYDQGPCMQLIDTFNNCVRVMEEERSVKKDMRKSGFTLSSESSEPVDRLSSQQVTKLLRRFPEPQ